MYILSIDIRSVRIWSVMTPLGWECIPRHTAHRYSSVKSEPKAYTFGMNPKPARDQRVPFSLSQRIIPNNSCGSSQRGGSSQGVVHPLSDIGQRRPRHRYVLLIIITPIAWSRLRDSIKCFTRDFYHPTMCMSDDGRGDAHKTAYRRKRERGSGAC